MKKIVLFRAWNQIKEIPSDRLSELPDSLLIHILSFLTVKEAAVTSVLSKRWRFLWSDVPRLEVWESENENEDPNKIHRFVSLEKTRRFLAGVNRLLAVRTTGSVDKFSLRMQYHKSYYPDIDKWIEYAIDNRVKTLILLIHPRDVDDSYYIPHKIYDCSSLEYLLIQGYITVGYCNQLNWGSLTELYLEDVMLHQELVDSILIECPVLRRIEFKMCYGFYQLDVRSPNIKTLVVEHSDDEELYLGISAPYLHFLDISFHPERKLDLDILSLCKARIDFLFHGFDPDEVMISKTKKLLQCIHHLEELQLKRKCFEVISMLARTGWQFPQSMRCRLEVSSSIAYKYIVSGIMALLESSPNLETLVLEGFNTNGNYAFLDTSAEGDLNCNLSCLKSIYFRNFADSNGEPMLKLVRILLKMSPYLEKMEIVVDGVESSDGFINIYQELLFLPRSIVISSESHQYLNRIRYKATIHFQ